MLHTLPIPSSFTYNHPNNIWREIRIMKFTELFVPNWYIFFLWPQYSPQHTVIIYPQFVFNDVLSISMSRHRRKKKKLVDPLNFQEHLILPYLDVLSFVILRVVPSESRKLICSRTQMEWQKTKIPFALWEAHSLPA